MVKDNRTHVTSGAVMLRKLYLVKPFKYILNCLQQYELSVCVTVFRTKPALVDRLVRCIYEATQERRFLVCNYSMISMC